MEDHVPPSDTTDEATKAEPVKAESAAKPGSATKEYGYEEGTERPAMTRATGAPDENNGHHEPTPATRAGRTVLPRPVVNGGATAAQLSLLENECKKSGITLAAVMLERTGATDPRELTGAGANTLLAALRGEGASRGAR